MRRSSSEGVCDYESKVGMLHRSGALLTVGEGEGKMGDGRGMFTWEVGGMRMVEHAAVEYLACSMLALLHPLSCAYS